MQRKLSCKTVGGKEWPLKEYEHTIKNKHHWLVFIMIMGKRSDIAFGQFRRHSSSQFSYIWVGVILDQQDACYATIWEGQLEEDTYTAGPRFFLLLEELGLLASLHDLLYCSCIEHGSCASLGDIYTRARILRWMDKKEVWVNIKVEKRIPGNRKESQIRSFTASVCLLSLSRTAPSPSRWPKGVISMPTRESTWIHKHALLHYYWRIVLFPIIIPVILSKSSIWHITYGVFHPDTSTQLIAAE